MKVLFINRMNHETVVGGDTLQMENTAAELRKRGVEVVIYTDVMKEFDDIDLIHFFNLTRPTYILALSKAIKKPYVISTIYVDYAFYKVTSTKPLIKWLTRLFGSNGIEYIKILGKHFFKNEKVHLMPYLWLGQKRSIQTVLKNARMLLPNSVNEYNRILMQYGIEKPYKVIPNGVNISKFIAESAYKRIDKHILCVGQIETRKNQMNLIRAVNGTDFTLTIIGRPAPNHISYAKECQRIAGENVEFIPFISQNELVAYYEKAEIHALPSWFETTGLVSLEAAFMGCKIIITEYGDTKEYFKNFATYCDPSNVGSIRKAIQNAHRTNYNPAFKEIIRKEYSWQKAGEKTLEAYNQIMNEFV